MIMRAAKCRRSVNTETLAATVRCGRWPFARPATMIPVYTQIIVLYATEVSHDSRDQ